MTAMSLVLGISTGLIAAGLFGLFVSPDSGFSALIGTGVAMLGMTVYSILMGDGL